MKHQMFTACPDFLSGNSENSYKRVSKNLNKLLLILFTGIFLFPAAGFAQKKNKPLQKAAAHRVLVKTAFVIRHAHKKVKENKVYTGNLARAMRHQKYARILYRKGNYVRAMHQSRRARYFALLAIKANKGEETSDMNFSKEDEEMMKKDAPSDSDLDKEVDNAMKNEPMKDEDIVNSDPDVDLKDGE
jgi:hypothetical protein